MKLNLFHNKKNKECGTPECPCKKKDHKDPNCICGKPLLLYIPPGELAYPCPVHPERAIKGADITW